jgi:UDP-N-acetylglucosamine transferase subunit ALG13
LGERTLIFVTVGLHKQGFERLIKKMDEIAGNIDEEVIMQIGSTSYKPKYAKYFESIEDFQKIIDLNKNARVVVCHGGAGVILTALDQGTPVIAVPRLKRLYEHFNDHQLEIVDALAKEGKIIAVYDVEKMDNALNSPFVSSPMKIKKDKRLVRKLKEYINRIDY